MAYPGRNAACPSLLAAGLLTLGACAVEAPAGPTMPVMPGNGKTLAQFQQDDATCRQFADQQTGGASPATAANTAAIGSAAIGTGLGAATGALIGAAAGDPAIGAAIGAGAGLLAGSAVGANNAQGSAGDIRQRYDVAYQQCMATQGNQTSLTVQPQMAEAAPSQTYGDQAYGAPHAVYAAPPQVIYAAPPVYAYPAPYPYYYPSYYPQPYYYPRPYWGPVIGTSFFFSFGNGGGHGHHHHHHY